MMRPTREPGGFWAGVLVFAFIWMGGAGAAPVPEAWHEAGIPALQAEMDAGRLSSRQLTEHFIRRIEALDRHGPRLNSVIELNPDALAIADALDRERAEHGARGPLHGIPVLIKDNIDTSDRMLTTAGSLALMADRPQQDAFLVQRLREAGAVLLGKTNLSEWANFRSSRSSSGWSARGGQTLNPYDPTRSPCGSSSGSGVAVAAGFAVVAVGTETDGSIVCPSSVNGIVGLKPTVGLISRSGIVPISISQDTAGPMARTVEDAAILLDAMVGRDPADAATAANTGSASRPGYATSLAAGGALRGARIGVVRELGGFHEGVDAVFEHAVSALRAAGAELVDPVKLDIPDSVSEDEMTVLLYEFKDGINRYLAGRTRGPRSLSDLIAFNRHESTLEMAFFQQELFLQAQHKAGLEAAQYQAARSRAKRLSGPEGIDAALAEYRLDALVAPTVGAAWTIDLVNGDHYPGGGASSAPAVAGYPHITVPAGYLHGLPIGLSFFAGAWSERKLLRLAEDFEGHTGIRRPPVLPETLDRPQTMPAARTAVD